VPTILRLHSPLTTHVWPRRAWSQQGPLSRHRTRKLKKEGEKEKVLLTTSSVPRYKKCEADRETYSDISYRFVLELPQITDTEESDEDDGVEYDFR